MFNHSVKVPRLYKTAAKILQDVNDGKGSIKSLVYEKKHPNVKALYALAILAFQRNNDLNNLLKRTQLLTKESRLDPWLARILISELLWGKKRLPGESKPVTTILGYEQIFRAHLSDAKDTQVAVKGETTKLRYVRINTLLLDLEKAIDLFREEDWNLNDIVKETSYKQFLEKLLYINEDEFFVDIHIPNLLIFPPKTEFYKHPGYKNGSLILQDKASCLPVHILGPPPGSTVLDMCAAPGMKTTQLAAVMNDTGTVYAVERDQRRFQILNKLTDSSGAKCIKTINKDILDCDSSTFPGVEYILVDPSCSGSGITDRLGNEEQESKYRLEKLAGFQIKILRSALVKYPEAKRVVYSTCSIYPEENENVVRQVLETNQTFKLVPAAKFLNNNWVNFGSSDFGEIGKFCLYAKPTEDLTNGFFVAVFERLEDGETNEFFNDQIFYEKRGNMSFSAMSDKEKAFETEKSAGKNNKKLKGTDHKLQNQVYGTDELEKKKKSKKNRFNSLAGLNEPMVENVESDSPVGGVLEAKKKRKKRDKQTCIDPNNEQSTENETCLTLENFSDETTSKKKKKRKIDDPQAISENKDIIKSNNKDYLTAYVTSATTSVESEADNRIGNVTEVKFKKHKKKGKEKNEEDD